MLCVLHACVCARAVCDICCFVYAVEQRGRTTPSTVRRNYSKTHAKNTTHRHTHLVVFSPHAFFPWPPPTGADGNQRSCLDQGQGGRQATESVSDTLPSPAAATEEEQIPPPATVADASTASAAAHDAAPNTSNPANLLLLLRAKRDGSTGKRKGREQLVCTKLA